MKIILNFLLTDVKKLLVRFTEQDYSISRYLKNWIQTKIYFAQPCIITNSIF